MVIEHLDEKAREVGLRVKDIAVSERHTCSLRKAAEGTKPCFLFSVGVRKALNQA